MLAFVKRDDEPRLDVPAKSQGIMYLSAGSAQVGAHLVAGGLDAVDPLLTGSWCRTPGC